MLGVIVTVGVKVVSSSKVTVTVELGWIVVVTKVVKVSVEVDVGVRLTISFSTGIAARAYSPFELSKHPEGIG